MRFNSIRNRGDAYSVSAITLPKYKESKAINPAYSFSHLSGRRFRYASALDPGGIVAVLLRTLDR